jgi:hypothetical protein
MNDLSVFSRIVEQSLLAFPGDAHQQIHDYLLRAGINEKDSLKFRQAWSRTLLGMQSFGRKQDLEIDRNIFVSDLIRELSFRDNEVEEILDIIPSISKIGDEFSENFLDSKNHESKKSSSSLLDSLNTLATIEASLSSAYLNSLDAEGMARYTAAENTLSDSLVEFRQTLRGVTISWKTNTGKSFSRFSPLDSHTHGSPTIVYGLIDTHSNKTSQNELLDLLGGSDVIGLRISPKQPVFLERAWDSFACLNEFAAVCKNHNVFSIPITSTTTRENSMSGAILLTFENPRCQLLKSLRNPAFATYLCRYPAVPLSWCLQIASLVTAAQLFSGRLLRPINTETDVFVRDNGLLLVGNVSMCQSMYDTSSSSSSFGSTVGALLTLLQGVLATSMGLSRRLQLSFVAEPSSTDALPSSVYAGDFAGASPTAANLVAADIEQNYFLIKGSKIEFEFRNIFNRPFSRGTTSSVLFVDSLNELQAVAGVLYICIKSSSSSDNRGGSVPLVSVSIHPAAAVMGSGGGATGGNGSASATTTTTTTAGLSSSSSAPLTVCITAMAAGVEEGGSDAGGGGGGGGGAVTISFLLLPFTDSSGGASRKGRAPAKATVNVMVMPSPSIQSVYLQEIVGLIEESFETRNPELLLQSECFRQSSRKKVEVSVRPASDSGEKRRDADVQDNQPLVAPQDHNVTFDKVKISHDWTEILRLLASSPLRSKFI